MDFETRPETYLLLEKDFTQIATRYQQKYQKGIAEWFNYQYNDLNDNSNNTERSCNKDKKKIMKRK